MLIDLVLLGGSRCVCWLLIGPSSFLRPRSQSLLAKQPTVTAGRPVVSVAHVGLLVYFASAFAAEAPPPSVCVT